MAITNEGECLGEGETGDCSGRNYNDTGDGSTNNVMLLLEVVVVIEIHYKTTCQKQKQKVLQMDLCY